MVVETPLAPHPQLSPPPLILVLDLRLRPQIFSQISEIIFLRRSHKLTQSGSSFTLKSQLYQLVSNNHMQVVIQSGHACCIKYYCLFLFFKKMEQSVQWDGS